VKQEVVSSHQISKRSLNLLLLNPPARQIMSESMVVPPLGIAYLAAVIRRAGYRVAIKDASAEQMSWERLVTFLKKERPDILGLSSMSPTIDVALKAVNVARPFVSTIIMGGPHVSVWGQEIFRQCPELDLGVVGEGEETMVELMAALAAGRSPAGVPGVIGKSFVGPSRPLISDLDTIPFPARDLLPLDRYHYPFSKTRRITTLFTSRGCPFECIFCDKSIFGTRWRARSAQNILAEIDELVERFNIPSMIIYDDLFTLDDERTRDICEGILSRGYKLDWKCESRVNLVNSNTLKLMKRAGCTMIAYGVESGNQVGLDYLNKKITIEQIKRAFAHTHEAGIATMAYFILGIPVESYEDELHTINFAKELNPDYVQFSVLSPFYGTKLHQEAVDKEWYREIHARNPMDKDLKKPVVMSPQWNAENLQRILRCAYYSFYFRPRYICKRLVSMKNSTQLLGCIRGFSMLRGWLKG